jgi:hypothetical protein
MKYSPACTYSMSIHEDAERDLDRLYEVDEDGTATIDVFLQEAASSPAVLDRLLEHRYRSYDPGMDFEVQRWAALWKHYGLWRLKLFDVPGTAASHRVIYAFHGIQRRYYILGIVPRDFDYEPDHAFTRRIVRAYQALGIPT